MVAIKDDTWGEVPAIFVIQKGWQVHDGNTGSPDPMGAYRRACEAMVTVIRHRLITP